MPEHKHDWRRQPDSVTYRVDKENGYLVPIRCADCPAKAWGKTEGLVKTWPRWEGPVVEDDS